MYCAFPRVLDGNKLRNAVESARSANNSQVNIAYQVTADVDLAGILCAGTIIVQTPTQINLANMAQYLAVATDNILTESESRSTIGATVTTFSVY